MITEVAVGDGPMAPYVPGLPNSNAVEDIDNLIFHTTDEVISPLIYNARIEKVAVPKYSDLRPGFTSYPEHKWSDLDVERLEAHLGQLHAVLISGLGSDKRRGGSSTRSRGAHSSVKNSQVNERTVTQVLKYLQVVCSCDVAANAVANSTILSDLVRRLGSSVDVHREQSASVIGTIMRHATLMDPTVNMSEVITALADSLRDNFRDVKLKRRLIAALGETLFYIASESANAKAELSTNWRVPSSVYSMLKRCILDTEDKIVCHYAVKTVENLSTIVGEHARLLATNDCGLLLWTVFAHNTNSHFRQSCAWAIARLSEFSLTMFQHIADKAGFAAVIEVLRDPHAKVRQPFINIMLLAFDPDHGLPRLRLGFAEEAALVENIMHGLDSSPTVLRAKCYLLLSRAFDVNRGCFVQAVRLRLFHGLEKDSRRAVDPEMLGDQYLFQCGGQLFGVVARLVPVMLKTLNDTLVIVSGRKRPSASQAKALRMHLAALPAVLSALVSPLATPIIYSHEFIESAASIIRHLPPVIDGQTDFSEVSGSASDELISGVVVLAETLSNNSERVVLHAGIILDVFVPALAQLMVVCNSEVRMASLRTFSDLIGTLLAQTHEGGRGQAGCSSEQVCQLFDNHILPLYDSLLADSDPIPVLAVKILSCVVEQSPGFANTIVDHSLAPIVAGMLQQADSDIDEASIDVLDSDGLVYLLHRLIQVPRVELAELCEEGLVRRCCRSLAVAVENGITGTQLIAPLLQIIYRILYVCSHAARDALNSRQNAVGDHMNSSDLELIQKGERFLQLVQPMIDYSEVFLTIAANGSSDTALCAMRCIALLFQLHSSEATRLLILRSLDHLSKALSNGASILVKVVLKVLQRVLAAFPEQARCIKQHKAMSAAIVLVTTSEGGHNDNDDGRSKWFSTSTSNLLGGSFGQAEFSSISVAQLASHIAKKCGL